MIRHAIGLIVMATVNSFSATPALASPPNKLFWCTETQPGPAEGTLVSANPNGTGVANVRTSTSFVQIRGCTYDPTSDRIFLLEGSNLLRITPANAEVTTMQSLSGTNSGLAIDPGSTRVYWSDTDNDRIQYASSTTAATTPVTLISDPSIDFPVDIELDSTNGKLYIVALGPSVSSGSIARVNLDGTGLETIVSPLYQPWGIAVDPANNRLFYTLIGDNSIWRANSMAPTGLI